MFENFVEDLLIGFVPICVIATIFVIIFALAS